MDWKPTAKRVWGTLGVIESIWAIYNWIASSLWGPSKVAGMIELHPPFYQLLAMLGIGFLVLLNYGWLRMLRPKNQFYAIAEEGRNALSGLYKDGNDVAMTRDAEISLRKVKLCLERLRIPCPLGVEN